MPARNIERTVRELMQMVVIDLTADENAQEIFETLNARGAQLTAADLIKSFVFQRLSTESGANVEAAYWQYLERNSRPGSGNRDQRGSRAPPAVLDVPQPLAYRQDR